MATVTQIIRRRHRREVRRRERAQRNRIWTMFFGVLVVILLVGPLAVLLGGVAVAYAATGDSLPTSPQATVYLDPALGVTELYDSSGQALLFTVEDPLGDGRRWITLDELPDYVWQATLLWEDPDFLETGGFNLINVIETVWNNWLNGPIQAQPSITRHLVRNAVVSLPDNFTVDDTAQEIALVAEINRRYSAEEILEWHLNTNNYGNGIYGIAAAAQVYLGKSASALTVDETALLVTIPTEPRFNPIDDETAARGRQSNLLRQMLAAEIITRSQFDAVINVTTPVQANTGQQPAIAPEFGLYAREQAESILDTLGYDGSQMVARGGLRVTTSLDLDLYYQAECMLRIHLARLADTPTDDILALDGVPCYGEVYLPAVATAGSTPPDAGTIVVLDPATGIIKAMIGPAQEAKEQPGPTLYPFVYLHGFLNTRPNYTAATMLMDIRNPYPGAADGLLYFPNNPDGAERGPISLRDAMGAGLLAPVAQVAHVLNLNTVLRNTAVPMGIDTLNGVYDLSLLERGGSVSVMDVSYAYATLASLGQVHGLPVSPDSGRGHDPTAVLRIEDAAGNLLWQYGETPMVIDGVAVPYAVPLLSSEVAYIVNDVLADPATRWTTLGQGNVLETDRTAAVVYGMTSNRQDGWTVGYTPQLVTGVHVDRRDGGEMTLDGFGIGGTAPLWRAITDYIHDRDSLPGVSWPRPDTITEALVCEISGMAPTDACDTRAELFLAAGQVPPEDTYWRTYEVNTQTGQLATVNTPAGLRRTRAYFIPPAEAMDWWEANNLPLPPATYDTYSRPEIVSSAEILRPQNFDVVGGLVDIRGSVDNAGMVTYQLAYGQGANPGGWIDIGEAQDSYFPGTSLGMWDTSTLDGTYALRLTVTMRDGTFETDIKQVIVDNIPPAVVLSAGEPGQVYLWPDDGVIPLVAEVTDNYRRERVEFYRNGQFVGVDEDYPFGYEHLINRTGTEVFTAVAFDAVGNTSEATIQVEVRRAGE